MCTSACSVLITGGVNTHLSSLLTWATHHRVTSNVRPQSTLPINVQQQQRKSLHPKNLLPILPPPHRMSPHTLSPAAPICRYRRAQPLLGRTLKSTREVRHATECASEERLPDAGDRERGDGRGKECSWGFGGQRKEDGSHGCVGVARAYVVPERPGDCRRLPMWFRCPSRTFYPLSGSGSPMAGLVARTELGNRRVPNTREYGLTESV